MQCTTLQYAGIATILCKLGLTVEAFLTGIKYVSGNSGSGFTIATLLCWPRFKDTNQNSVFPLDSIKDYAFPEPVPPMAQVGPTTTKLHGFYSTYWIEPLKAVVKAQNDAMPPNLTAILSNYASQSLFLYGQSALYSQINSMSLLPLGVFAPYLAKLQFKDMDLANSLGLIVSLGATLIKSIDLGWATSNTSMNTTTPQETTLTELTQVLSNTQACPPSYANVAAYAWDKPYSDFEYFATFPPSDNMTGMPFNMLYAPPPFAANPDNTAYLTNPGKAGLGNLTYSLPQTSTVATKVPMLRICDSRIGESQLLAILAASSSQACITNQLSDACTSNFFNNDQTVLVDMNTGLVFANSADQAAKLGETTSNQKHNYVADITKAIAQSPHVSKPNWVGTALSVPTQPLKDNGVYRSDALLMNLCNSTNSYDTTGILGMLGAMQVYENPTDLLRKTYTILYFDGPVLDELDFAWPSNRRFGLLFDGNDKSHGLQIFSSKVSDYTTHWKSRSDLNDPAPHSLPSKVSAWVDVYYYENLVTIANDFCNIRPGIKLNILVLAPHSQAAPAYAYFNDTEFVTGTGYEEMDYHANLNAVIVECFIDLEKQYQLISNAFGSYACTNNACTEQPRGGMTRGGCLQACHPTPPSPHPSPSPSALGLPAWQIALIVVACILLAALCVVLAILKKKGKFWRSVKR